MTAQHPHPTLVDPADILSATTEAGTNSWWFASRLEHQDSVFWALIHTMSAPDGGTISTISLFQESAGSEGHTSEKHAIESADAVTLSTEDFEVRTSILSMSGDLDRIEISGTTDTATIQLTLRREDPVLFSAGSGYFPFFGSTTGQYALPGLLASGTITADGVTYQVTGRTWLDRQWGGGPAEGATPTGFTWLGLDLGGGRYLSVWDTQGDGTSWLTELRPDGTHTVTHARRTGEDGHWTLTVPSLDATLEITHTGLSSTAFAYTGVGAVTGKIAGQEISGHGYTDIIG